MRRAVLGDRVVSLNSQGVPFGLKGTVITVHEHTGYVEVLFDQEFTGGKSLQVIYYHIIRIFSIVDGKY
jgi:ribosomal protein L35AE/L33A